MNPDFLPTARQEWNQALHNFSVLHELSAYIPGYGTFALPETVSVYGLAESIHRSRLPDGTYPAELAPLQASRHWDTLVGDPVELELRQDDGLMQDLSPFVARRAEAVRKADLLVCDNYGGITRRMAAGIKTGIAGGYIPGDVVNRLGDIKKTVVRVVDQTVLDKDTAADYGIDDFIRIGHESSSSGRLPVVLGHELVHKLSGGTFVSHSSNDRLERARTGFTDFGTKITHEGLTEAWTQHVTMGVLTGDFETVDPDLRADGDMTYYDRRKIAAEAVRASEGLVEARDFTRAIFEDSERQLPAFGERRQLVAHMRAAYGPGSLRKLNGLMDQADELGKDRTPGNLAKIRELAKRIYAPIYNIDGSLQPGFIDIDGL